MIMFNRYPVFQNEIRILSRNRLQLTGIFLFLLLGLYSVYYGKGEIVKETQKITGLSDSINIAQKKYAAALQADTSIAAGRFQYETAAMPSLVRFNYNFIVADIPAHIAALSLGQRELYPSYYILNAQSLYVQTLKGEINNPFKLSAGNFDLSFVIVFLLPLLIIALGFDLYSSDKEAGIVPFLRVSNTSLRCALLQKILFRVLATSSIILLLFAIAVLVSGTALFSSPALLWLLIALCYNALWHSIVFWINSLRKSSAFNAIKGLAVWVLLLIIIPATLNVVVQRKEVNALGLSTLMRSRNMPSTKEAMTGALDKFYTYYPEMKARVDTASRFFFFQGYSAFLYNTDQASAQLIDSFTHSIQECTDRMQRFLPVNPAVNILELFNDVAGTGIKSKFAFRQGVTAFHKKIFWFSNGVLFDNRYMTAADYANAPSFVYVNAPGESAAVLLRLSWVVLLMLICVLAAYYNLGEKRLYN